MKQELHFEVQPALVRLIGDSHGNLTPIRQAVSEGRRVIDMGDLGFAQSWRKADRMPNVYVLGGNHDDYLVAPSCNCYLGDYGDLGARIPSATGVFFLRGALSIDRDLRIEGRDWWAAEELSEQEIQDAIAYYAAMQPRIVISHEAPLVVNHILYGAELIGSRTATALWRMLQMHEPERWYFGHHHVQWERQIGRTRFRGLAIDEAIDVDLS